MKNKVPGQEPCIEISTNSPSIIDFLAAEYECMAKTLFTWNNQAFLSDLPGGRLEVWNDLSRTLGLLETKMKKFCYKGLSAAVQTRIEAFTEMMADK